MRTIFDLSSKCTWPENIILWWPTRHSKLLQVLPLPNLLYTLIFQWFPYTNSSRGSISHNLSFHHISKKWQTFTKMTQLRNLHENPTNWPRVSNIFFMYKSQETNLLHIHMVRHVIKRSHENDCSLERGTHLLAINIRLPVIIYWLQIFLMDSMKHTVFLRIWQFTDHHLTFTGRQALMQSILAIWLHIWTENTNLQTSLIFLECLQWVIIHIIVVQNTPNIINTTHSYRYNNKHHKETWLQAGSKSMIQICPFTARGISNQHGKFQLMTNVKTIHRFSGNVPKSSSF